LEHQTTGYHKRIIATPWVVGIREGVNNQITLCKLEGTIVGSKEELRRRTIDCKMYRVGKGLFEGYMW